MNSVIDELLDVFSGDFVALDFVDYFLECGSVECGSGWVRCRCLRVGYLCYFEAVALLVFLYLLPQLALPGRGGGDLTLSQIAILGL